MTNPTQPETVLTREQFAARLLNIAVECCAGDDEYKFLLAHFAALRQRVAALEAENRKLGGDDSLANACMKEDIEHSTNEELYGWLMFYMRKLAAVTKDAKDSERHLLGIIAQLLTFAPRDDSSKMPLPGWVVAIVEKAKAALQGSGEGHE